MLLNLITCHGRKALLFLLLQAQCLLGQEIDYYRDRAKTDSSRAYWQVKTLASSRCTLIQFYAADRTLVYEEKLPGKYFKLTPHNQAVLDTTLQLVLNRQLLATQLKTRSLHAALPAEPEFVLTPASPVSTFVKVTQQKSNGKIYFLVENPGRKFIYLTLTSEANGYKYTKTVSPPKNHRSIYWLTLDVHRLPVGDYAVALKRKSQVMTYKLRMQPPTGEGSFFQLRAEEASRY